MDINRRFLLFLHEKKLTQKEFQRVTGFSQNNLSRFITGTVKSPKLELAIVLVKYYPDLNLRWFLLGEGEMFNKNIPDIKLQKENEDLKKEVAHLKELIKSKDKIIALLENK